MGNAPATASITNTGRVPAAPFASSGGGRYANVRAAEASAAARRFRPRPEDSLTIDVCEFWLRPLGQAVAAAFGGKHSFVVLRTQDKAYRLLEKHADGACETRVLPRSEYIGFTTKKKRLGWEKRRTASRLQNNQSKHASLRKGLTLGALRKVTEIHDGVYDVHSANCHAYSKDVWNACVVPRKEAAQKEQHGLSRLAQFIGIGASTRVQNQEEGFN